MHDKINHQFPLKIRIVSSLIPICMGLFKNLYFKKYRLILDYIENDCSEIISSYKSRMTYVEDTKRKIPKRIWVLWYDLENIKPIPKICLRRMTAINGYKTTILTKENISEYIDINDILPLFESQTISIQFFSDLIRARILKKYGGFWLDSTIAVMDESALDLIVNESSIFSIKLKDLPKWCSVSQGFFSSYFWATFPANPLFQYMDDCMTYFIKKHNAIIDYYQIDYTIMAGYESIPYIRNSIDNIPPSNPDIFWLSKNMNQIFNAEEWDKIMNLTKIFKLSWRKKIDRNQNVETNFDHLLKIWHIEKDEI